MPKRNKTVSEKQGDVLIVRKIVPEPAMFFLLRGDTFVSRNYEIPLQVFSYLKKSGKDFRLQMYVPRLLCEKLEKYAGQLGLSDCLEMLDAPPDKNQWKQYAEIVDAAEYLGTDLMLRKADKRVNRTAWSVLSSLQGCFEEKCP